MSDKKDWSYFQFKVGRYEPFVLANDEEKKNFKPYESNNKSLRWYVIDHDFITNEICPVNIFTLSVTFMRYLLDAKKKYKDNYVKFAEAVRCALQYAYHSKVEYEIAIDNTSSYVEKRKEVCIIDVYTQVMLNWNQFISYVWSNKRLITKKKLGIE